MTNSLIAVHGATGAQGAPVVRRLLADGYSVRAIARQPRGLPAKAEPVAADLLDPAALAAAYAGVDAVVVQLPLVVDQTAVAQAESVLAALEKAGVPQVVCNVGGPVPEDPVGVPFVDARVLLRLRLPEIVPSVSVVGPVATYQENLVAPWSVPLVAAGEVVYPLPAEAPIPWVAAADVAAAIAELIVAPEPVRAVAGPEDLTGPQVAAALTQAVGIPVRWRTLTPAEFEKLLRPHLGDAVAAAMAAGYENPPAAPDLAVVRRGPTSLREWAARQAWR
jgi:uncharacterized protein YbjT (DUF2867 family)